MSDMRRAGESGLEAEQLPENDGVRLLLEQHEKLRALFEEVSTSEPDRKARAFEELWMRLAAHGTAEQEVLRPMTRGAAGQEVVDARNHEEQEAFEELIALEELGVASEEFDTAFAAFRSSVEQHFRNEETEEFPRIVRRSDETHRVELGRRLRHAEAHVEADPDEAVEDLAAGRERRGPVAALAERIREALRRRH